MWDRSYRWQRWARAAAGALVLGLACAGVAMFCQTPEAARLSAAAREIGRESRPNSDSLIAVDIPTYLGAKPGHLVHLERADGEAEVIGRVVRVRDAGPDLVRVEIMLTPSAAGTMQAGGVLKGAGPTVGLEHAVRLLVSPDVPRDEAIIARNTIWPSIDKNVMPGLLANLEREVAIAFSNLSDEDKELLSGALEELRTELAPLEEKLIARLSERAWGAVGVGGVAEGVMRKATDGVENTSKDLRDWFRRQVGSMAKDDRANREFLSDETKKALRESLEAEAKKFWDEHRAEVLEKVSKVLGKRKPEFEEAFRKRWAPRLYGHAVVPAWQAGEPEVIKSAEAYANDFAQRRLLTSKGGPRLLLAHALRSVLDISDAPLLVLAPGQGQERGKIVYQPLIPQE